MKNISWFSLSLCMAIGLCACERTLHLVRQEKDGPGFSYDVVLLDSEYTAVGEERPPLFIDPDNTDIDAVGKKEIIVPTHVSPEKKTAYIHHIQKTLNFFRTVGADQAKSRYTNRELLRQADEYVNRYVIRLLTEDTKNAPASIRAETAAVHLLTALMYQSLDKPRTARSFLNDFREKYGDDTVLLEKRIKGTRPEFGTLGRGLIHLEKALDQDPS